VPKVRLALLTASVAAALSVALPVVAGTAAARESAVAISAAPQVVLVNQPAGSICVGRTFTVGVWFQQFSGGSSAFQIAIYGPRLKRFFYRHGLAPSSHWRFWKVRAGRAGRYRTIYSGHRPGATAWTHYQVITRARRC